MISEDFVHVLKEWDMNYCFKIFEPNLKVNCLLFELLNNLFKNGLNALGSTSWTLCSLVLKAARLFKMIQGQLK